MTAKPSSDAYLLGRSDAEHERLIRQARLLAPFTERLFRDAGIGAGQRVLDIGSGVGDVAFLAAGLVGSEGEVLGVDLDKAALAKARSRATDFGIRNVTFVESEVSEIAVAEPFDAVVGRFILQFLPDPVAVLRTLAGLLRPGGVLVFHEANWASFQSQLQHLPLRAACAALLVEAFARGNARTNMELVLYRGFQDIGLPAPNLRLEVPVGHDAETRRWLFDVFSTVRPRLLQHGLSTQRLGDLDTLQRRLEEELDVARSYASCVGLVGAWSRRPNG